LGRCGGGGKWWRERKLKVELNEKRTGDEENLEPKLDGGVEK
jgi:hypothetical protein